MPEKTPTELAAEMREMADRVDALDDAPAEPGTPDPVEPTTPAQKPAKPGRPDVVLTKDATTLTWQDAGDSDEWDVLDTANLAQPLKQTVREPRYVGSAYKPGKPARRYAVRARNAAGESELSDVVDVPPAGGQPPKPSTPSTAQHPSDVLDLRHWTVMLPTGSPEDPDNAYMIGESVPDVFYVRPPAAGRPAGVVFRARCDGVTSGGSSYPRSELRQMRDSKWTKAAWTNRGESHTLVIDQAITETPVAKPEVVAGQIHDGGDDVIQIHLSGHRLAVKYADGKKQVVLDENYQLGTRFQVRITAADEQVRVAYNGVEKAVLPLTGTGWYWKVGAYVQSNTEKGDAPTAAGEVVVYAVTVTPAVD